MSQEGKVHVSMSGGAAEVGREGIAVDCIFCRFWSKCPLLVATDLGRCLVMLADVKPGQVVKWPL